MAEQPIECPACLGTGWPPANRPAKGGINPNHACPECGGTGVVPPPGDSHAAWFASLPAGRPDCLLCTGSGRCSTCGGYGYFASREPVGQFSPCHECFGGGRCACVDGRGPGPGPAGSPAP